MEHTVLKNFIAFAQYLLERPGMFLINNTSEFQLVLFGYYRAVENCNINSEPIHLFLDDFSEYVNQRIGDNISEKYSWHKLIDLKSTTGYHSLELTRLLFSGYIEDNPLQFPLKNT